MKGVRYVSAAAALVAALIVVGCCCLVPKDAGEEKSAAPAEKVSAASVERAEAPAVAQKTCPVMGGPIDPAVHTDYEGRRVYFCCPACIDAFEKDPAKYLAKIDAEIAAGS